MIRPLLILLLACWASSWAASSSVGHEEPSPIPPNQMARYDELRAKLPPASLAKVQGIAPRLKAQLSRSPNASAEALATAEVRGQFPVAAGMDIQALAFIVVMQATTESDNDLRQSMAQMQARTQAKEKLRGVQEFKAIPAQPIAAAPNANNLSDISDQQSLELQMLMDRRSKLLQAASNMMKSMSQTSNSILQNIK